MNNIVRFAQKAGLAGSGESDVVGKKRLLRNVRRLQDYKSPPETFEQEALISWCRLVLTPIGIRFTASANGGWRYIAEAAKLKRMGVSAGYPDLTIPLARKPYHGLYIELKRVSGGKVSLEQEEWIEYLQKSGYMAEVCCGFDEARKLIENYLNLEEW